MKPAEYLEENEMTISEFARICNIPQPTMYRIVNEIGIPVLSTVKKVIEGSGGAITLEDFGELE